MSSDARVRFQLNGQLRGSHDGACVREGLHPTVCNKYGLADLIRSLEECMGQSLAWEIREGAIGSAENPDLGLWLAGYCAR